MSFFLQILNLDIKNQIFLTYLTFLLSNYKNKILVFVKNVTKSF